MVKSNLPDKIREQAINLGFLECGFSKVHPLVEHEKKYLQWLANGHHGSMEYMTRNIEKRVDPSLLVEGARTVISLLYNYYTSEKLTGSPLKIAKYAYGQDYHDVVRGKLNTLDQFIRDTAGENITQRCFVDSAPVLERTWAQKSGLGWIGKNSCLISRRHGSFFFIAEIITSLELDNDEVSIKDYCGSCQRCVDACPTQAITPERTINSNRCISYQTIENRNEIPQELNGKFENNVFGCDICQDVCPWNKKSIPHAEPLFKLREDVRSTTLEGWRMLDISRYQQLFKGSAVKRAKFSGLKRNISFVASGL
jgi:epoxyqueuosine reductase